MVLEYDLLIDLGGGPLFKMMEMKIDVLYCNQTVYLKLMTENDGQDNYLGDRDEFPDFGDLETLQAIAQITFRTILFLFFTGKLTKEKKSKGTFTSNGVQNQSLWIKYSIYWKSKNA